MTTEKTMTATIHDAVDDVATAVEGVHRAIAAVPFEVLEGVGAFEGALDEIRTVQDRTIGAAYDLVRTINDRVRRLTSGASAA